MDARLVSAKIGDSVKIAKQSLGIDFTISVVSSAYARVRLVPGPGDWNPRPIQHVAAQQAFTSEGRCPNPVGSVSQLGE